MHGFRDFILKWSNVFMWIGVAILVYAFFAIGNPNAPGAGVVGDLIAGLGRLVLMFINVILAVGGWVIDAIKNAPPLR